MRIECAPANRRGGGKPRQEKAGGIGMKSRIWVFVGLVCGAMFAAPLPLAAQDFPTRPIAMIVPFPPGGPTDTFGRIMAASMGETLGQPVIVGNVGGANGHIGGARVARALPQ